MIAQNTASTNFAVTLNRYNENGPLLNNEGFQRNSFRINLDHRFNDGLVLSVSGFHSRDQRDNTDGLSFTTLYRLPPDIDLTKKDENGEYARVPDPEIEIVNPLWEMAVEDSYRKRARTLGSVLKYEEDQEVIRAAGLGRLVEQR